MTTPNPQTPKQASENTQTPLWVAILVTCLIEVPQGIDAWISLAERIPQLNNIPHPSGIIWKKDGDLPKI